MALEFLIELEFRNVDFCGGRKTGEPGEKPSEQGREPTTNSTDPLMIPGRTRATLVGGERDHHCAIPAPQKLYKGSTGNMRFWA